MIYHCEDFSYQIRKKAVKNISIRVTLQGEVAVTVPKSCETAQAKAFVEAKSGWIRKHLSQVAQKEMISIGEIDFLKQDGERLLDMASFYFKAFAPYDIAAPQIKFRKMKTRWGSCNKRAGTITLNKALKEVPEECAAYVVVHELSHLVEANHGAGFYAVVASVFPEYKKCEKRLNHYALQE